jgi:hypothetical protein
MAFEFGVVSTDKIAVGVTTLSTLVTFAAWVYREGDGGGGNGRIFDKRDGVQAEAELIFTNTSGLLVYQRNRSSTNGVWRPGSAVLTVNTWVHIAITMDNTLTTNDPIFYVNGSPVATSELATPVGTLVSNTSEHIIGNRATDSARNWDGFMAHVAKWSRILTPGEIALMGRSSMALSPQYYPNSAVFYLPLVNTPAYDVYGNTVTVTGGQFVANNPSVIFPGSQLGGYAIGLDK